MEEQLHGRPPVASKTLTDPRDVVQQDSRLRLTSLPEEPRLRLPPGARVRRSGEVRRALDRGRSASSGALVIYAFRREDSLPCRYALVVGARWGGAVVRNRVRRLLREAFRTGRPELPRSFDIALVPRARLDELRMDQVRALLVAAANAAARRFDREGPGERRPRAKK